jgi:hypothetical protein
MHERAQRIAHNEGLFRRVNQRIMETAEAWGVAAPARPIPFYCECGDRDCTDRVPLAPGDYDRVRDRADQFVIRPGHEAAGVERVVDVASNYLVVRKIGEAAEVAAELDTGA